MIDIHTHILPGLDDGAATIEDSVEIARLALADSVNTIVATPHGLDLGELQKREYVETKVEDLRGELAKRGVGVEIVAGIEVYISPDIAVKLENGSVFGLNGSNYLLIELPMHQFPFYVEQTLFELQARGFRPIIAHPERNVSIQEDTGLLRRMVERGVLGQVTAGSLLGSFGPKTTKTAEALLSQKLVHVIASDAHSARGHRSPVLSLAVAAAARIVGHELALAMVTSVPRAILSGEPVDVLPPVEKQTKRLFSFWR